MSQPDSPILPHGGYRKLRSYKVAEAVYDATVVFCRRFLAHDRRTSDQMVQAARSGVRNISEGSGAAATSRKTEMKLTNVARASLSDELLKDFESFLRQNGLRVWPKNSPEARAMRERLAQDEVADLPPAPKGAVRLTGLSGLSHFVAHAAPELAANAMICAVNQAAYLLKRQLESQGQAFLKEGGFTENLHAKRVAAQDPGAPVCPLCGKPMRRRTAKKGPKAGSPFWGCSGYPECKGTRAATPSDMSDRSDSSDRTLCRFLLFFVGTYVADASPSIFLCRLDLASGKMEQVGAFAGGSQPSFLAVHPGGQVLYAVNERTSGPGGTIRAFAIEAPTGRLTLLNEQPSHGAAPCHITTDRSGRRLLAANYESGTVSVYPVEADGRLAPASDVVQHCGRGPDAERQAGPHAHAIYMDPANRFALACDLGLDKVLVYRLDPAAGRLLPHGDARLHPGAGPRHLDFHPSGRYVYVINELDSSVTAFGYDSEAGKLSETQTVTALPAGYQGFHAAAEIAVHPSGRFVYASNREPDNIAIFAVDEATGRLTLLGHEPTRGKWPRSFAIDPSGAFLIAANQKSDSLTSFRLDAETGALAPLHQIEVPKPVCVTVWR